MSSLKCRVRLRSVLSLRIIALPFRRANHFRTYDKKSFFHRKLTDLSMKLFNLTVLVPSLLDLVQEGVGNAFNCLPYTRTHLRRMTLGRFAAIFCTLLSPRSASSDIVVLNLSEKFPSLCHSRIHSIVLDTSEHAVRICQTTSKAAINAAISEGAKMQEAPIRALLHCNQLTSVGCGSRI